MQYLAWIQIGRPPRAGLEPVRARSRRRPTTSSPRSRSRAGSTALGVAPWLSLLLWKPVAVVGTLPGHPRLRAGAASSAAGRGGRRSCWRLFFGSFSVIYGVVRRGRRPDARPSCAGATRSGCWRSALMVARAARLRPRAADRRRLTWLPGAARRAWPALLHPWQGELLILIVVGAELVLLAQRQPLAPGGWRLPVVTLRGHRPAAPLLRGPRPDSTCPGSWPATPASTRSRCWTIAAGDRAAG